MSDAFAESYAENGYLILSEPVVAPSLVRGAREGMDRIRHGEYDTGVPPEESPWNPGDDLNKLCKIEQPQRASRAIGALIRSPEIGAAVARATGAAMVQVFWIQLLYKPPTPGNPSAKTGIGWHQDWTYWQHSWDPGSELLTAWFALSEVPAASGPMRFVPGSHRWKDVGGGDFNNPEVDQSSFRIPPGQVWREVPALMRAGGMSLHGCHTLHGSSQNVSDAPRCSLAIHCRTDRSRPLGGKRFELNRFVDDEETCPIIFGKKVAAAF